MPLTHSPEGSEGFKRNIETEMAAGKSQDQSVAIAYKMAGERNDEEPESPETIMAKADALFCRIDALMQKRADG